HSTLHDGRRYFLKCTLLKKNEIAGKLSYINTYFGFLPHAIISLKKSQVRLVEQLQIVDKVVNDLSRAHGKRFVWSVLADNSQSFLLENLRQALIVK
ncbi:hypothetical protein L9F63_016161, partial [Diploptera punctata]